MRVECAKCGRLEDETYEFDMSLEKARPMEAYEPGTVPRLRTTEGSLAPPMRQCHYTVLSCLPQSIEGADQGRRAYRNDQGTAASAARSSARRGGLLSIRSTWGGIASCACRVSPHPVSRMTGVCADTALIDSATLRPLTSGMPRSVMTTEKGVPFASASVKTSIPSCPLPAVVTACPSCSSTFRRE